MVCPPKKLTDPPFLLVPDFSLLSLSDFPMFIPSKQKTPFPWFFRRKAFYELLKIKIKWVLLDWIVPFLFNNENSYKISTCWISPLSSSWTTTIRCACRQACTCCSSGLDSNTRWSRIIGCFCTVRRRLTVTNHCNEAQARNAAIMRTVIDKWVVNVANSSWIEWNASVVACSWCGTNSIPIAWRSGNQR